MEVDDDKAVTKPPAPTCPTEMRSVGVSCFDAVISYDDIRKLSSATTAADETKQ